MEKSARSPQGRANSAHYFSGNTVPLLLAGPLFPANFLAGARSRETLGPNFEIVRLEI